MEERYGAEMPGHYDQRPVLRHADGQRSADCSVDERPRCGAVPICESPETKRPVGVVTDRDLALRVVAAGCDPKSTCVRDVMTREVFTCRPEDDLQKALELMEQRQVRRIPIVDRENRIVGIIAQADIATRLKDLQKVTEVVQVISRPRAAAA